MRVFAITLVIAQLAVSLFLVGWILANAGLLQGPVLVIAIGLAVMTALAVAAKAWLARRRRPIDALMEENS